MSEQRYLFLDHRSKCTFASLHSYISHKTTIFNGEKVTIFHIQNLGILLSMLSLTFSSEL